jgi:hypothetical protein
MLQNAPLQRQKGGDPTFGLPKGRLATCPGELYVTVCYCMLLSSLSLKDSFLASTLYEVERSALRSGLFTPGVNT